MIQCLTVNKSHMITRPGTVHHEIQKEQVNHASVIKLSVINGLVVIVLD